MAVMVGEHGPELWVPVIAGTVIAAEQVAEILADEPDTEA